MGASAADSIPEMRSSATESLPEDLLELVCRFMRPSSALPLAASCRATSRHAASAALALLGSPDGSRGQALDRR